MVFETLVADLLNRYLGTYLETLNASQLRLGLLSGELLVDRFYVLFHQVTFPWRMSMCELLRLMTLKYL